MTATPGADFDALAPAFLYASSLVPILLQTQNSGWDFSPFRLGRRTLLRSGDELASGLCGASLPGSSTDQVAKPSGNGVQTGLHQVARASILPPLGVVFLKQG